jgi:hypothetical protein
MMVTVIVYKYETASAKFSNPQLSRRMGTAEYVVKRTGGWIVEGSEIEVDASNIDESGKTKVGFSG